MKGILAALALAALLPAAASASDIDYTYADLARSRPHSDIYFGGYDSTSGYRLDGSFGFAGNWFVEASRQRDQFDFNGTIVAPQEGPSLRAEKTLLGAGFHAALSECVDFVVHADYGQATTSTPNRPFLFGTSFDDHGYNFGLGLRYQPLAGLELDAGVDHDDLGFGTVSGRLINPFYRVAAQAGEETVLSAAVRYRFGMLGVGIEYRHSDFDGWRDWLFSLRANF